MTDLLEVKGLVKRFGDLVAVDGVSFQVSAGECYGLLGPNGAGKTTTISMVCGLLQPDAGDILVNGNPVKKDSIAAKQALGLVPQNIALYPDLNATENLKFWGRLYGLRRADLTKRVAEVLDMVGLTDRARDRVSKYSGGMQRRLNIAAGLLHEPRLLILDEPTVGVDPQSRNAILEYVEQLKSRGTAVLYTTHYMEEAERLCDRVGIIDQGKIIAEGARRELVSLVGQRDRVEMVVSGDAAVAFAGESRRIDGVDEVIVTDHRVELIVGQGRSILPALLEAAARAGAEVTSVEVHEPDLEAVFLHLTGKGLRD